MSIRQRIVLNNDPDTGSRINVHYTTPSGEQVSARWLIPSDAARLEEAVIGQGGAIVRKAFVRIAQGL